MFNAVKNAARRQQAGRLHAIYTDDTGHPIGATVQNIAQPIPAAARGVHVGRRPDGRHHVRPVLGIDSLTASADATVVPGG